MESQGLDPNDPNDIMKVLFTDEKVQKAFLDSAFDKQDRKRIKNIIRIYKLSYSSPYDKEQALENIKKLPVKP